MTFLKDSLFLTLTVLRSAGQVFFRMSLSWDLSAVFSHDCTEAAGSEEESQSAEVITYRKYTVSTRYFIPVNVDLDHLAQVVSIRLHHCSVCPSMWYSLKKVTICSPYCRDGESRPLFEGRAPTLIIWNSSARDLSQFFHLFIYSTIYLNQCDLPSDIYFTFWVIINTSLLLKFIQL